MTISASYGAGGSVVGPAVAERLGLRFFDRAIPAAVARDLSVSLEQARQRDDRLPGLFARALANLARTVPEFGDPLASPMAGVADDDAFRKQTEAVLREIASGSGGVVLGRAAAVVLADTAGALHVRLSGPKEARIARVLAQRGGTRDEVERELEQSDRARTEYVKHFYRRDPRDPALYHLTIDASAFPVATVVDLIVAAARARDDGAGENP